MKISSVAVNVFLLVLGFEAMKQAFSWPLILLLFFLFSILFNSLTFWLVPGGFAWRNHHTTTSSKLCGPKGWPLLGSLTQMGSLAHRNLANIASSCGATRLMALSLGATRMIISSHPDTANEILRGTAFSDRPMKDSVRLLMFERAMGFAPSGEYWRHLRRLAASHMFSPKRISGLEVLRQHIADDMLKGAWKEMEERGFVEIRGIIQMGSMRNILKSLFGSYEDSEAKELRTMVEEGYDLIAKFNGNDYFPFLFLDFYGVRKRCHRLAARVRSLADKIVRKTKGDENSNGDRNDFLSVLLSLPMEDRLSDSDIVAVLWEMMFRGTDTVAILLEWIMARLVLHQDIQAKAQKELDMYLCEGRYVQDSDILNLPYLQAIVKEVLRMHPPGPLLSWARLAVHDVYVDKTFIPAGTTAMVNMWAIAHDPSIWKDPFTFRPERFIEDDVSVMGSDLRLAPFGSGRRMCPGKTLGLATVQLWLARFLHEFKWLPMPAQPVDLSECLKLSLEMKKPLVCSMIPRK
ncbi:Cytochrome P450 [Dillenia turbinata]|uniref:Cytochrome P450 n=1 Tax=Dillenia turbinata TaxID=194707 RepID=A0AAN8VP16_9MAGN